jgi:hypothetical protein
MAEVVQFPVKLRRYRFPDEKLINPRPWIMRGLLLKKQVTAVIAAGGTGKSIFGLVVGLHLCAGRDLGPFKCVGGPKRVAVLSVEEDDEELDRRLAAIRRQYGFTQEDADRLFIINIRDMPILAQAEKNGSVRGTKAMQELERLLLHEQIEVFLLDPFVEVWAGNENDNSQVKSAAAIFRATARRLNAACLLTHHVKKGAVTPGDVDAARGGSSLAGLVRIAMTMTNMTAEDANAFQLETHKGMVRLDNAKANYLPGGDKANWFKFHDIELDNGRDETGGHGDHVGVLAPWAPPALFEGIAVEDINKLLNIVELGLENGVERYSTGNRSGDRYVVTLVCQELGVSDHRAQQMVSAWVKSGLLIERDYMSFKQRKTRKGLYVDDTKRPSDAPDTT